MYSRSSQLHHWHFSSQEKLQSLRHAAYSSYVTEHRSNVGNVRIGRFHPFLGVEEDRLVVQAYEHILLDVYRRFNPPLPHRVIGAACQYYKRFYLHNTAMEFPPKDILVACLYLAAREQLANIPIQSFKFNFEDGMYAAAAAWVNLHTVRAKLHHQLTVHNPFEVAFDFLRDLKLRGAMRNPGGLWPYMRTFLVKSFLTDVCLLHTSLEIAIASFLDAASILGETVDQKLLHVLFRSKADDFLMATENARAVRRMVNEQSEHLTPNNAALQRKLINYYNNPCNTDYITYRATLGKAVGDLESLFKYNKVVDYGVAVLDNKSPY